MSTTWRRELETERQYHGDTTALVAVTPDEAALDVTFDDGYGGSQGPAVTVWTERRVYFPITYDGAEWMGSAPRNPCDEALSHQGGQ